MEIMTYLRIIARYWWIILLTTLVAAGVALGLTAMRSNTYTVHVRVVAQPAGVITDTRILSDLSGQVGTRSVIGTFAEVFTAAEVRDEALKASGMSGAQALEYPLQASVLPDSSVIEVTVSGHDPVLLAGYVNATVDAAVKHGSAIYRVIELSPLERAPVPQVPTSPVPSRDIPIGAGLGLALGVLLAFATEYTRAPRRQEGEAQIRALPASVAPGERDDRLPVNAAPQNNDYLNGRTQQRLGGSPTSGGQSAEYRR